MSLAIRLLLAALVWGSLCFPVVRAAEPAMVAVASYANTPEVSEKEGQRATALLAEKGIRGIAAGSAGATLNVPADRAEEALEILAAAKHKEGLRLTLLLDVSHRATWPVGPGLKPELKLGATLDDQGVPVIRGELKITNLREEFITAQSTDNRSALAFLVFNSLGNPVAPEMRGKADPAFTTLHFDSQAAHSHPLENLDFVTGSAWTGYDLKRGGSYRVIAVYRPAAREGPGFSSDEVVLKIPP